MTSRKNAEDDPLLVAFRRDWNVANKAQDDHGLLMISLGYGQKVIERVLAALG